MNNHNYRVLALILGGGKGTRLYPLTKYRAKPAVPIAAKFRIIDIPISNCLNSGLNKIFVLTQFNTHSLHRHIYDTYQFGHFSGGFVDILAAQQTIENMNWYQGTADAVRQNLHFFADVNPEYILILSGDHLYRMDYLDFLRTHIEKGGDITMSAKPVSTEDAGELGILQTDETDRILRFVEKPNDESLLSSIKSPGLPEETPFLASMGIYMFSTEILFKLLKENPSDDFGRHIIPFAIDLYRVYAYRFDGYWRDIGTIESFFKANLEMASVNPPFSFYDERAPFYTRPRILPGSRLENCKLNRALIGDGCYIKKSSITNAVIGIRTIINSDTTIENSVIMGADFYEINSPTDAPHLGIGRGCLIRNAIIDKNARIGDNVKIINKGHLKNYDGENYNIRDNVVVIPKNTTIHSNTII